MAPPRKEICDCGVLENSSKEPNHPIRFDPQTNEYYIAYGSGGRMIVYYCPFCGGRTPESRRSSFFAHVSNEEERRICRLFEGIRTVADVIARYGPPDEERDFGSAMRHPEREGTPARGEVFRNMIYRGLSPVADVVFEVGTSESVRGSWIAKYVGDKGA